MEIRVMGLPLLLTTALFCSGLFAAPVDETMAKRAIGAWRARGGALIALSTSGNSANCVNAALVAKAKGMKVVSMTGAGGGKLGDLADAAIKVPETETYKIQELHLPIYHALCAAIEEVLF